MAKRDQVPHLSGRTKDYLFPTRGERKYKPSLLVRWQVARGILPKERLVLSADQYTLLDHLTQMHREQTKLEDEGVLADY